MGANGRGAAGAAILRPRTPMTPRTSIAFDSVTKVATAALAMRLVEAGPPAPRRPDPALVSRAGAATPARRSAICSATRRASATRRTATSSRCSATRTGAVTAGAGARGDAAARPAHRRGRVLEHRLHARRRHPAPGRGRAGRGRDAPRRLRRPGGAGLAFQPAERPHPPLAHPYFYPKSGATPVDARAGGPYLPSLALGGRRRAPPAALAGDVPSLARWGHALLGGHLLEPGVAARDDALRPRRVLGRATASGWPRARSTTHEMWGHGGDGLGTHTEFWHLPRENAHHRRQLERRRARRRRAVPSVTCSTRSLGEG